MALLRTFVSIHLSPPVRDALRDFSILLKPHFPGARWERPDKLHLTLKFLGGTDESLAGEILGVIRASAAGLSPFPMIVSGFGAFPSPRRPRVLWVGCDDPGGTLTRIRDGIERGLAGLGIPEDDRPFHPHVTIARMRDDGDRTHLTSAPKNLTFDPRHTLVSELFLMKSVLQPAGSEHTVIGSVVLP
jgi:2'-5' RNA ligase